MSNVGSTMGNVGSSVGSAAQKAKTPALIGTATVASVVGGLALRSKVKPKSRPSVLPKSNPFSGSGKAFKSMAKEMQSAGNTVGKHVGKKGLQVGIGDFDMEVRRRDKSQQDRRSPVEVVLDGLTARRPKS